LQTSHKPSKTIPPEGGFYVFLGLLFILKGFLKNVKEKQY